MTEGREFAAVNVIPIVPWKQKKYEEGMYEAPTGGCDEERVRECEKCGIKICAECPWQGRYHGTVERLPNNAPDTNPKLILSLWTTESLVAYCEMCDERVDRRVRMKYGVRQNEGGSHTDARNRMDLDGGNNVQHDGQDELICNCNVFDRWICLPCRGKELKACTEYYSIRVSYVRLHFNGMLGVQKMAAKTKRVIPQHSTYGYYVSLFLRDSQ